MCNENASIHVDLSIEVKCSRQGKFQIGQRDLDGLRTQGHASFGYLASLMTLNSYAGPYWALIPVHHLSPRSYSEKILASLKADFAFWEAIDYLWGEVLLNHELMDKLLGMEKIDLKSIDWWNQLPCSPLDRPRDAIRRIKLDEALQNLRQRLDLKYQAYGAKREGFLHQSILCFCLLKSGFPTISNNSGVPDLKASLQLKSESPDAAIFLKN